MEYKSDVLAMIRRQRALNHLPGAEFATTAAGIRFWRRRGAVSGVSFRRFVIDRYSRHSGWRTRHVQEDVDQVISATAPLVIGVTIPAKPAHARPSNSFAGPNGVVTSVEDLARWDANFYEYRVGISRRC